MWKKGCLGLALLASLARPVSAQIPLTPPSAGGATPLAAPPATQPTTLCDFLGLSKAQLNACKEYMCKTQLGQLMNNSLMPIGAFTGGILGPCCPPLIMSEQTGRQRRRRRCPHQAGRGRRQAPPGRRALPGHRRLPLLARGSGWHRSALRTDRDECVRWEAAMALGSGCCCNKATIRALAIVVSSSDEDGYPSETAERSRRAAARSLRHCLSSTTPRSSNRCRSSRPRWRSWSPRRCDETGRAKARRRRPESSAPPTGSEYYKQVKKMSMSAVVEDARRTQARVQADSQVQAAPAPGALTARSHVPRYPPCLLHGLALRQGRCGATEVNDVGTAGQCQAGVAGPARPDGTAGQCQTSVAGPGSASPSVAAVVYTVPPPAQAAPVPAPPPVAVVSIPVPPPAPSVAVASVPVLPAPPLPNPPQLVAMLQTAVSPDQREWAADHLGDLDGSRNPQAVQAVVAAARNDQAPLFARPAFGRWCASTSITGRS